jgi:hypothetical protein
MPWRISHDPIQNSEAIFPLPLLSQNSTEAACGNVNVVLQCLNCYQGIFIDSELKVLRLTTQALLGTQMSGAIFASWPNGSIAADELPFIIDIVSEKTRR